MYRRILVAVDGSHYSERAVERAAGLAKGLNAEVLGIVHVRPNVETWSRAYGFEVTAYVDINQGILTALEATARRLLAEQSEKAQALLEGADTRIEIHDEAGPVVPTITEVIRKGNYDLLVVGSRGMGRAAGLLLGSVSQALLAQLPTSILVVRAEKDKEKEKEGSAAGA